MNPPLHIHSYLKWIPYFPIVLYNYIPRYITILTPVRDLITFLEGDKTPACFVYHAIIECINRLHEIKSQEDQRLSYVVKAIISQPEERLNAQYSLLMLKISFYLTPQILE